MVMENTAILIPLETGGQDKEPAVEIRSRRAPAGKKHRQKGPVAVKLS